jgi:hypothetical protein
VYLLVQNAGRKMRLKMKKVRYTHEIEDDGTEEIYKEVWDEKENRWDEDI